MQKRKWLQENSQKKYQCDLSHGTRCVPTSRINCHQRVLTKINSVTILKQKRQGKRPFMRLGKKIRPSGRLPAYKRASKSQVFGFTFYKLLKGLFSRFMNRKFPNSVLVLQRMHPASENSGCGCLLVKNSRRRRSRICLSNPVKIRKDCCIKELLHNINFKLVYSFVTLQEQIDNPQIDHKTLCD